MHNYTPIADRKIRLALVGRGRIANNHFGAIENHADSVELVDVCDVNVAALALAVSRTKANGHSNLTDLLKTTRLSSFNNTWRSSPRASYPGCCFGPPCDDRKAHGHPLA